MKNEYKKTVTACFVGYIVQAVVNNFVPLLFLTFQKTYGLSLSGITWLVTLNFGVQLTVDLLSVKLVDRLGYRFSLILAHAFSAAGLILLTILPEHMASPFAGILIAVILYAVGGGLLEVVVSPTVEACPTENKEKAMSLLHSFYCFGHVGVVLLSTLFFAAAGTENWKWLALFWALIPLGNMLAFFRVPIAPLMAGGEKGMKVKELLRLGLFWLFFLMMICAGASEQAVSQWASAFAEKGLGVSKTLGDLMGPMAFALLMGLARAFYGRFGDRLDLDRYMKGSCLLCLISYLLTALSSSAVFSLIGCALCGLSVGIMWPGSFSKASRALPRGGTALFALLALGGDIGCAGGPTLVGLVSGALGEDLKAGILAAVGFPLLLLLGTFLSGKKDRAA